MHNFVEYLRAKRAVRIALILLGLFMVCAIVIRVIASVQGGSIELWESGLQHSPTAHVTRSVLSDGTTHIVVDDPQRQTHAEIFERPGGRVDMNVSEPARSKTRHDGFSIGNIVIHERTENGRVHTIVHATRELPRYDLGVLFSITVPLGLIVASLLGGVLSKENDTHLDLAWTKPVSRERYALAAIVTDAAAIVISQLLAIAATLIATLLFFVPRFTYGEHTGWYIGLALAGPLAWYACVTAASASLKRGPGIVIGLGWVVAIIVPGLAQGLAELASENAVAAFFYAIFKALSYVDPIAYLTFNGSSHGGNFLLPLAQTVGVLCALVIGYAALALVQWRRLEA